jgi:hypothetical protein
MGCGSAEKTDTAGSSGETGGTAETGETGDSSPSTPFEIQGVAATLHDAYESLVYVTWEQSAAGSAHVTFSFDKDAWQNSPSEEVSEGAQSQLLLGIPYGDTVTYRVVVEVEGEEYTSEEGTIETGEAPSSVPEPTALSGDETLWDEGMTHVLLSMNGDTSPFDMWVFIFDRQGRVVWAHELPPINISLHPRLSYDETELLIDYNTYWALYDGGERSTIMRMKIDGAEVIEYETPGLHHPFTELADGSIAYGKAVDSVYTGVGMEELVLIDSKGEESTLWRCEDLFEELELSAYAYCQSNTLTYDAVHDHFLFSMYSLDTIIVIDASTGATVRSYGNLDTSWAFDPEESRFWWQHGGYMTEAGTLLTSTKDEENGRETVVREYEIDEANESLVQIWSFGEGEGIYGSEMGDAHRLDSGNTLHNYGSAARLREVTSDGQVVWDVNWNNSFMGRSAPITDLWALLP